jgi:hypothetical protein
VHCADEERSRFAGERHDIEVRMVERIADERDVERTPEQWPDLIHERQLLELESTCGRASRKSSKIGAVSSPAPSNPATTPIRNARRRSTRSRIAASAASA